jgi:hypothetical protein
MPIDTMLVSAAVISMFLVFAGVLAWGEIQTRPLLSIPENSPVNAVNGNDAPRQ